VSKVFSPNTDQTIRIDPVLISIQASKHFYFIKPRSLQNIFHLLTGIQPGLEVELAR
jgi:hypothetical protein